MNPVSNISQPLTAHEDISKVTVKANKKKFSNSEIATLFLNAKVLEKNGELNLALILLQEACSRDSKNEILLDEIYNILVKFNRLTEAEIVMLNNQQYNYSLLRTLELAKIYYLNEKEDNAFKLYFDCLSQFIEDDKILFEIYKNIANIYLKQREFDLAEEYFFKAYQLNNSSDVLLINIGVLEYQKKDIEKSLFCFRKAIELNNKNDKAWVGLAMVHLEFGDKELSWGNLVKALDNNPMNKTALILLAQNVYSSEMNSQCQQYLIKYLEVENFDEEISLLLINSLIKSGDYQNAYLESYKNLLWNPENKENNKVFKQLSDYLKGQTDVAVHK